MESCAYVRGLRRECGVGPERFRDLKLQQAEWLAKETDISEDEALQIVDKVGFDVGALRREARLFKQSKRAKR